MRRFLPFLFLVCVVGSTALAAAPTRSSYEWAATSTAQPCSVGSCTRSAPTLVSEGMLLGGLKAYRLEICAASGQTLSGAGTMQAWLYDYASGLWMRTPDLDQTVTATTRCQSFADFLLPVAVDARVVFAASAVTVSGGSGLDVLLEGS